MDMWYLLSTVYALIFVLILLKFKASPRITVILSCIVMGISIGLDVVATYDGSAAVLLGVKKILDYTIGKGRLFRGFFYIPVGMLLAKKKIPASICWGMFLGGFVLNCISMDSWVGAVFIVISSVGFFGIIEKIRLEYSDKHSVCRKMSTGIYFIHLYVWTIYYAIVYREKTYGLDAFLVTLVVCVVLSYGYTLIKREKGQTSKRRIL